jgi:NAD(P) transhydrogenase subunit beta
MLLAVITAFVSEINLHWGYIIAGLAVGGCIGTLLALKIQMTAMNRSFANVIMGKPMGGAGGPSEDEVHGGKVKSTSAEETAMVLESARHVVIVPGYGMAVSQVQFEIVFNLQL